MCEVDYDDGESWSMWEERQVKARKAHRCDCCDGTIAAGELYRRHFSVSDGSICCERACAACVVAIDRYIEVHRWRTNPGGMPDLIEHCVEEERDEATHRGDQGAAMVAAFWDAHLDDMKARAAAREAAKGV